MATGNIIFTNKIMYWVRNNTKFQLERRLEGETQNSHLERRNTKIPKWIEKYKIPRNTKSTTEKEKHKNPQVERETQKFPSGNENYKNPQSKRRNTKFTKEKYNN
jgi:hypothetical protein